MRRRPSAQLWTRLRPLIRPLDATSKMRSSNFGAALCPSPSTQLYAGKGQLFSPANPFPTPEPAIPALSSESGDGCVFACPSGSHMCASYPYTQTRRARLRHLLPLSTLLYIDWVAFLFSRYHTDQTRENILSMAGSWPGVTTPRAMHPRISGPNGYLCPLPSLQMWSTDTNMYSWQICIHDLVA